MRQNLGLQGCQIRGPMTRASKGRRSNTEFNKRALASKKSKAKGVSTLDSDNQIYDTLEALYAPPPSRSDQQTWQVAAGPSPAPWKPHKAITALSITAHTQPQNSSQDSIQVSTNCLQWSTTGKPLVTLHFYGIIDKGQSGWKLTSIPPKVAKVSVSEYRSIHTFRFDWRFRVGEEKRGGGESVCRMKYLFPNPLP